MSHDYYAAWSAAELANRFKAHPADCFTVPPPTENLTVYASREGRTIWPHPDGLINIENGAQSYRIALELKRQNEGIHGILTALGQAQAYIHKGIYSGVVIVVPQKYATHEHPGDYIRDIITTTSPGQYIGVFSYDEPDTTKPLPFENKLNCNRPLQLDVAVPALQIETARRAETQWVHVREGSSTASAFFRYLQTSKRLVMGFLTEPDVLFPLQLTAAVERLKPGANPFKYLSNSVGDNLHDIAWRNFWFNFVFHNESMPLWVTPRTGPYTVNDSATKLELPDGSGYMKFFVKRKDSIKRRLIAKLNEGQLSENEAWEKYVENVRKRAHSFREDVDSGLEHLGFITDDGKPSELGYRFVDSCERTGDPNSGTPKLILGAVLIKNGELGALLHYIYKLSEAKFKDNPLRFATKTDGQFNFDQKAYLLWVEEELVSKIRVMRKVSLRGGASRQPFQGELAILRHFGFANSFRVGVGLEINWPNIMEAMEYEI